MTPRAMRRTLAPASALLVTLTLAACGKSASVAQPTPPAAAPPPPVVTVVTQGGSALPARVLGILPFTTAATGTLDVTVDWTLADDEIWVYLARGSCSFEQFALGQCDVAMSSEVKTPKPRRLKLSGAAAGAYTLMVGNLGPKDESLSYQITLTTGGASAVAGAAAGSTKGAARSAQRWQGGRPLGR